MGGKEFDADDARDVLKLEALKANMCFVSENVDKDNARMGKWEKNQVLFVRLTMRLRSMLV